MANEVSAGSVVQESLKNRHMHPAAEIGRGKLELQSLSTFPQQLLDLRVHDAMASLLPATGGTDDLGLYTQTWTTTPPQVQTGDVKALGAVTRRTATIITLPDGYEDGLNVRIRCRAGMKTTVADVSATIDVEALELLEDGTVSADLCTTAAQNINSTTYDDFDFVITSTTLVAGSRLQVRISIATNDAAGATAVIGVLHNLSLRCDCRP